MRRKKGKGHWAGDRKQTTLWHIFSRDQDAETVHGTQKPVECMRRPILNNSSPGQAIHERFTGSGTTLIAAETTGRVCLGIVPLRDPEYDLDELLGMITADSLHQAVDFGAAVGQEAF